jgi:hypothetical protein
MLLSLMYHFSTSVISGGLPLASSHPSTAYCQQALLPSMEKRITARRQMADGG